MEKREPKVRPDRRTMMLEMPISKVIPKMALPTIVAFLINSIYSLADTYFVSELGTNATAAVSVNSALEQIIMIIIMCFSDSAASIYQEGTTHQEPRTQHQRTCR